jgi:hypothetical protein
VTTDPFAHGSTDSQVRAFMRLWRQVFMALKTTNSRIDGVIVVRLRGAIYFGEEKPRMQLQAKMLNPLVGILTLFFLLAVCGAVADWRRRYRNLAMRRQRNIAKVAVGRSLAIKLYCMWRNGWEYSQSVEFGSHANGEVCSIMLGALPRMSIAPMPRRPRYQAAACTDATAHPRRAHHRTTSYTSCSARSPR